MSSRILCVSAMVELHVVMRPFGALYLLIGVAFSLSCSIPAVQFGRRKGIREVGVFCVPFSAVCMPFWCPSFLLALLPPSVMLWSRVIILHLIVDP